MSEVDGALHVLDRGTGSPTLLFVHGFASSSRLWSEVIDRLEGFHRCVAPDLSGFGRSPIAGPDRRIEDQARELQALVGSLNLGDFVLVGHSMGGKIAAAFAALRPPGLKALVLLASSPPGPEPMDDEERTTLLRSHGDREAMEALAERITVRPVAPEARAAFVDDNVMASQSAWEAWLLIGSREDLSDHLSALPVTPLVVAGADDPVLSLDVQNALARRLSTRPPLVLPETGHLLPIEAPDACAGVLRDACKEDTSSAS